MIPEVISWDPSAPGQLVLLSRNTGATEKFGRILAGILRANDVLSLDGDLGAGKTALTRGIAAGLHCRGLVSSPTFTLLIEHPADSGGLALYHFDVYRLGGADDFYEAGLDEYLEMGGVCVIEWGSLLNGLLPPATLTIRLHPTDPGQPDCRRIELAWPGDPGRLALLVQTLAGDRGDKTC